MPRHRSRFPPSMPRFRWPHASVAIATGFALAGLAATSIALADARAPAPAFCATSGCATVRASAWSHPLDIPLPALGLAFFAIALVLAVAGPRVTRLRRVVALAGGAAALGLVAIQGLVLGAWCRSCLLVDG